MQKSVKAAGYAANAAEDTADNFLKEVKPDMYVFRIYRVEYG